MSNPDDASTSEIEQCDYCGDRLPAEPVESEHGRFCDSYHAEQYENHYTGLFTRLKRKLRLGSGLRVYGSPPGDHDE